MIEEKTIIKELKLFVKGFDTNTLAAGALKVTPAQLSTTLNGKANVIPEKILKKLGYKSKLVYLPLKDPKPVKRGAEAGTSEPKVAPAAKKPGVGAASAPKATGRAASPATVDADPIDVPVQQDAGEFISVREG